MSREFEYKIEYSLESGEVVATIPELGYVSSYGASFAEAEANVREAALGYFEVLAAQGKEALSNCQRA